MRLKHDFKDDNLERKETAKYYLQFINKLQGNHTIALDAPWGSGKSTFIDFMCEDMDKDENKDIYIKYNAWDNDYTDEPFLSLMSEMFSSFEEKKYIEKDDLKNVKSKAIAISKAFGKGITKGLVKNILGSDAIKDLSDGIESLAKGAISETSQLLIDSTFKNMSQTKKTREQFTEELKSTTSKIIEEKSKDKLIIIIDELDRCKPTFAIELLENIKHLFAIDEIIFFIAVDRTQLAESVKAVYGSGFDSDTYLHRFFDMEFHLPKKSINIYFNNIIKESFSEDVFKDGNFEELIPQAINSLNLTLRDFHRIITETLLLKELNEHKIFYEYVCIVLLMIKYKRLDLYTELKSNIPRKITDVMNENSLPRTNALYHFWSTHIVNTLAINKFNSKKESHMPNDTINIIKLIETTL